MAGIGGIYQLNTAPVQAWALQAMSERLHRRGASATNRSDVYVGLFARFFGKSENAFISRERLMVSADSRLDNCAELAVQLGLPDSAGDAQVIAAAYERWGVSCPAQLIGEFAFAIWDPAKSHLFCARDLFGIKPFYFHHRPRKTFIFGSEIKALLASGDVADEVDDERVADYLAGFCGREDYTFYKQVRRLPSAHAMIVDQSGIRVWQFGTVEPDTERHENRVEAFRERFLEAVQSRMRDCGDIGITLSGGLDSASIAGAAADLKSGLHTFSAVFENTPECDERPFITDVTNRISCSARYVSGDIRGGTAMAELEQILKQQDEPFDAPNAILPWRLYRAIGETGLGAALDGHGGDEVVSHGTGRLKELAAARKWRELHRELRPLSHAYEQPFLPAFLGYVGYGLRRQSGVLPSLGATMIKHMRGVLRSGGASTASVVSDELRRRTDLTARLQARSVPAKAATECERHLMLIDNPERAYAFEVLDRIAHAFGVEPRYPFWDIRLVRLSLSVPPEQKLKNGYERWILREAMKGHLPDSIRRRRTKTNFLPNLIHGLTGDESKVVRRIQASSHTIQTYVDSAAVGAACNRLLAGEARLDDVGSVLRTALLHKWLENRALRARKPGVHQSPAAVCAP